MQDISQALLALDRLYGDASLAEYQEALSVLEEQLQQAFPGFTIAYAVEIGTAGADDAAYHHGGVAHVLLPVEAKEHGEKQEEKR